MDKREAKRRARWAAANALISDIQNGWEIQHLTDDYSEKQTQMISDALADVITMLLGTLPEDYEPSYPREDTK